MRPDTFDAVIAGLEQAGFKSWRGGKGGRTFSTEVCHGGDSPRKLSIWPRSDGGFGATCFTAGLHVPNCELFAGRFRCSGVQFEC